MNRRPALICTPYNRRKAEDEHEFQIAAKVQPVEGGGASRKKIKHIKYERLVRHEDGNPVD